MTTPVGNVARGAMSPGLMDAVIHTPGGLRSMEDSYRLIIDATELLGSNRREVLYAVDAAPALTGLIPSGPAALQVPTGEMWWVWQHQVFGTMAASLGGERLAAAVKAGGSYQLTAVMSDFGTQGVGAVRIMSQPIRRPYLLDSGSYVSYYAVAGAGLTSVEVGVQFTRLRI